MKQLPRGSDTRSAVRALVRAVDSLTHQVQQLRLEVQSRRGLVLKDGKWYAYCMAGEDRFPLGASNYDQSSIDHIESQLAAQAKMR